jgi:hypothetical protein
VAADVGRYSSDAQVLLRGDPNVNAWMRLAPRVPLSSADPLLSLPTYRPQVLLANGVQLTFAGHASFQLGAAAGDDVPLLILDEGRVVMVTGGKPGAAVRLRCGPRTATATLGDVHSAMAVQVRRLHPLGADPEAEPAHVVVEAVATSGHMLWMEDQQPQVRIDAGQQRTLVDQRPGWTTSVASMPDWIDGRDISDIDRRASDTLRDYLTLERDASLALQERALDRRAEVRSLAVRALACLGDYEAVLGALDDVGQRSSWGAHVDILREAMARSPQDAAKVREAVEKVHGGNAPSLGRMLWGYSPRDLDTGGAGTLVQTLDDQSLPHRVLAFENLRRITGATLLYRPEFPEARRRLSVVQWQDKLQKGEVVYKTPPTVLPVNPAEAAGVP